MLRLICDRFHPFSPGKKASKFIICSSDNSGIEPEGIRESGERERVRQSSGCIEKWL
jgi:hypothetical protein